MWPETTTSTALSNFLTMSTMGRKYPGTHCNRRSEGRLMDQHDDGLDAARLQFGDQRIHRLGLVAEFEPATPSGETIGVPFNVRPMKATGMPRTPDLVRRETRSCRCLLERAGGEIVKFAPVNGCGPWHLSTGWQPPFCIRSNRPCPRRIRGCRPRKSQAPSSTAPRWWARHGTSPTETGWRRSGRRPRRRSCCLWPSRSSDQRRHVFGATGGDGDLLGFVLGIGDGDPARRRAQIAVKIVDRENARSTGAGVWACDGAAIAS